MANKFNDAKAQSSPRDKYPRKTQDRLLSENIQMQKLRNQLGDLLLFLGRRVGCQRILQSRSIPELEEQVSEALAKTLSADDLKAYRNALRLRNFNLGIAAVAYMRRVVENRLNDLLEVLHEAATVHGAPAKLLARHQPMMKEKRFSTKVDYAGNLLPKNLRPEGKPNPMAILHELASDGLHAKTDEECVDIFDACRETFEYVYGKLRIETEDAKKFLSGIANLTEKRAKLATSQKPKPEEQ
jgi:hypothetical protein